MKLSILQLEYLLSHMLAACPSNPQLHNELIDTISQEISDRRREAQRLIDENKASRMPT